MTLDELLDTFEFFDDWEDKYRFIIDIGKELPGLPDGDKTDAHLIRGCQSQVWLTYESSDEGLKFNMDSDAHIVRGLIAVVLIVIQNRSASEIQCQGRPLVLHGRNRIGPCRPSRASCIVHGDKHGIVPLCIEHIEVETTQSRHIHVIQIQRGKVIFNRLATGDHQRNHIFVFY